ncbi:peptidoglycan-binding protein [Streptomyces sp. ERV7]|uniref:L,D-transpeptidase family protein n=1 Tax=Streptomyces sp. ERV7 TaxID=1322334 RepID=UPI0007F529F8|nr:L,D-transpeptidase family protein [Streptomyces sp. ERV7]OAR24458.1 peptidoglycan-binding protein [Streptomyces sp. ERV7]
MRRNHLTTVIARTLAAATVLTVTAACGAQSDKASGAADQKPAAAAPSSAPSADTANDNQANGAGQADAAVAPSASAGTAARPQPKVLMAAGAKGAQVTELQARLAQVGWFDDTPTGTYGSVTTAAVKGFQGKRGLPATGSADATTWQKLADMTTRPTRDELAGKAVNKPKTKLDKRCMTGRVLCISKTTRTLNWVVNGKVQSSMDVRFGSQYTPTREGTFKVFLKSKNHVSSIYHTPMPYAMFFSGGQAVHYSSDFAKRGYAGASHGCVNVRDKAKLAKLFDQVKVNDKVVIYW